MTTGADRRLARATGGLYLFVVLTAPFALIYVPSKLFVRGDAGATVHNLLAHEMLFRASIVIGLLTEVVFVAVVMLLYRLLRRFGPELAVSMVILILLDVPIALLNTAHEVATMALVRGSGTLTVFEPAQRNAVATLLLEAGRQGSRVSEMFWGLWLLPLGVLVYRSKFLPRFLGVWLLLNGLGYVATSVTGILAPSYHDRVLAFATPVLFGEVALMLWLLVVGVRITASPAGSRPASTAGY